MQNPIEEEVVAGLNRLGLALAPEAVAALGRYAATLLQWNAKLNLTAITDPLEVAEKHLVDSLAVLPDLPTGPVTLLDLGAGAGLPGIPLAIAVPDLNVHLVDAVAKKIGFLKNVIAQLGLYPRVTAAHGRAEGDAAGEKTPRADVVVSRAFVDLERWLPLARAYLAPQGRVLAMLGQAPTDEQMRALAAAHGLYLRSARRYSLPHSAAPRASATFGVLSEIDEAIPVAAPRPELTDAAQAEIGRIAAALGTATPVEHIGSTAVPDLRGRPVVDLLVGASSVADRVFEQLGYRSLGWAGRPGVRLFRRRVVEGAYDLHVAAADSSTWNDAIATRELLRRDSHAAARYAVARDAADAGWLDDAVQRGERFQNLKSNAQ